MDKKTQVVETPTYPLEVRIRRGEGNAWPEMWDTTK